MNAVDPANVLLFTNAPVGGRGANDANNKVREHMILAILNNSSEIPFNDPIHGPAWTQLKNNLCEAIYARYGPGSITQMRAVLRGGRRFNYDFDLIIRDLNNKLELKVGDGTHVDSLPEFFNPAANYDFHNGASYAGFFYDNYLQRVLEIYPPPPGFQMPTREWYIEKVHGTSKIPPLFAHLYNSEAAGSSEQKQRKKAIVDESITSWLNQNLATTNIARLTENFLRTQGGKIFLLYDRTTQRFYTDQITNEELTIQSVAGIKNGNVLVLQSTVRTTTFHMLLRWKNHAGVLYPAWQISMRR